MHPEMRERDESGYARRIRVSTIRDVVTRCVPGGLPNFPHITHVLAEKIGLLLISGERGNLRIRNHTERREKR